jgi:restriction system protein
MAIPDYQSLLLPILKITADGGEWGIRDLNDRVAEQLAITPADKLELLPSGRQPVWENRIGWARTYLKKARLLDSPRRAVVQISDRGRELAVRSGF